LSYASAKRNEYINFFLSATLLWKEFLFFDLTELSAC